MLISDHLSNNLRMVSDLLRFDLVWPWFGLMGEKTYEFTRVSLYNHAKQKNGAYFSVDLLYIDNHIV